MPCVGPVGSVHLQAAIPFPDTHEVAVRRYQELRIVRLDNMLPVGATNAFPEVNAMPGTVVLLIVIQSVCKRDTGKASRRHCRLGAPKTVHPKCRGICTRAHAERPPGTHPCTRAAHLGKKLHSCALRPVVYQTSLKIALPSRQAELRVRGIAMPSNQGFSRHAVPKRQHRTAGLTADAFDCIDVTTFVL